MVKVVKTEKDGHERVMMLEQKVWDKFVKKPWLVPGVKWRLWVAKKPPTTRFVEVPIDAEVEIITKKPAPKKVEPEKQIDEIKPVIYGEKDYKADLVLGKKSMIDGDKETAKAAFKRTLQLKPKNPYVKKQLKLLEA